MDYSKEKKTALDAVIEACRLCSEVQKDIVSGDSLTKNDKSPVTIADYAAQAIVNYHLTSQFEYPVVGEEDSSYLKSREGQSVKKGVFARLEKFLPQISENRILDYIDKGNYCGGSTGKFWTLDPIDGTKGFLRMDQYAVALSLIDNGEVVLGVLGCPNLIHDLNSANGNSGCYFIAEKGKGSFLRTSDSENEIKIGVSDISDLSMASFCESVESSHSSHNDSEKVAELLGVKSEPVRIDSQCKYAVIARGDASIYLRLPVRKDYQEKIWDHAAGCIIVEEAGGKVTDCLGNKLDFSLGTTLKSNRGIVATNGKFHNEVISAVGKVLD